jgi:putative RNA 2'-phosphotransferase
MTVAEDEVALSKLVAWMLRHAPHVAGLELDAAGWTDVDAVVRACRARGFAIDTAAIVELVARSDKARYALSDDGTRIRAQQGHSIAVDLDHAPAVPPAVLFHGTVDRFLPSIRREGLVRGARHHVHLSAERTTAVAVGARRGRAVVLEVEAGRMHADGLAFLVTPNRVWLTQVVPPQYLREETQA